jgi:hypothetical protein
VRRIDYKLRRRLYLAGMSVDQIKLREQAIWKQVAVAYKIRAFLDAQDALGDALLSGKSYQAELAAADAAFLALQVRRGQLV